MELQMQVPSVQSDTSYSFQIKTTYGSKYSDFKLINLQVKDCLCANCYICTSDPNSCKQCINGYKISNQNKTCILDSLESSLKSTQTTLQVAVGINTFFGAILSALNLSSTQIVWSSINQSQLYLLIPMLNIFIQAEVLLFLEGFNFSLLSLSFLKLENIDFKCNSDDYFESIGIKYINSVRNIFQLGLTVTFMLLFHALVIIPVYCLSFCCDKSKCFRKCMKRVLLFFTFTFYIRVMIESFLLVAVSYFNEFWTNGVSYSCFLLIFWVLFCMVYVVNWIRVGSSEFDFSESYFREFFSSLKESRTSRAYFGVFLMRRLALIVIIFTTKNCSVYVIASVFGLPSLLCLGYYCKVRPFSQAKDNLIEIINEFSFNVFCCALIFFNRESVWSDLAVSCIIYFLLACSLICLTIHAVFICTLSISKLCNINSSISRNQVTNDQPNAIQVTDNTNIEERKESAFRSQKSKLSSNFDGSTSSSNISIVRNEREKPSIKSIVDNLVDEWNANRFEREERIDKIIQRSRDYQYDDKF